MATTTFDDVRVAGGDLTAGTGGLSPSPAVLNKGIILATPAGNSTYGDLRFQIKTAGGVTYTNTLHGGITQAADLDWTWPIAYPAGTYALTSTTGGVLGFAAFGTGTVGGSGTDNHIVRWDGTGNIQDSGWIIDDTTDRLNISKAPASGAIVEVTNTSTTAATRAILGIASGAGSTRGMEGRYSADSAGIGVYGEAGNGGTSAVIGVRGFADSSSNASYGGSFNRTDLGNHADLIEGSAPADPDTGDGRLYAYTDGTLHYINDASLDLILSPGRRSIMLRAYEMWPSTTAPAIGPTVTEMTTNKQNLQLIAFQGVAGKVYAEFTTPMPDNWDGGSVYATFYWTANNANTSGVRWGLECRSYGDAETIDQAWGTAGEVTDTESGTAYQMLKSAETSAITPAGSPAGGELLQCRVYRDASHGDDAELGSVDLIAVRLEYSVSQFGE